MPKADFPEARELHEIGRRLCARLGVKPREPITATGLRGIIDERGHTVPKVGLVHALRACADALAVHELSPELRRLRDALDEYLPWLQRSEKAARQLWDVLIEAIPVLDAEAANRAAALKAVVLTEEQRTKGCEAKIWPSPESLCGFPREVAKALPHVRFVVLWLQKTLQDLTLVDADPRVTPVLAPPRVRMAKALATAGYSPSEITTITHPFARTGIARTRARNAVVRRLRLRDDQIYPTIAIPPGAPDAEKRLAAIEDAVRFVAGGGHDDLVVVTSTTESAVEADVVPPPERGSRQPKTRPRERSRLKR